MNLTIWQYILASKNKITGMEFCRNNILVVSLINSILVKGDITDNKKKSITYKQIFFRI